MCVYTSPALAAVSYELKMPPGVLRDQRSPLLPFTNLPLDASFRAVLGLSSIVPRSLRSIDIE